MQVFNQASENYMKESLAIAKMHVLPHLNRVRLSPSAAVLTGGVKGSRLHFVKIGGAWYMMVNEDPQGFKLHAEGTTAVDAVPALYCQCAVFIEYFNKETGHRGRKSYTLRKTQVEHRGWPLYEIILD